MPQDLLGQRLGPYVIRQRLGQGGMGTVYLAHDTALDRLVALKVLEPHFARDKQFVDRFQREARAAAKLNHPHIVQVYTVDIASDPPYMVMEYVNGASIDRIIATKGPFTWQQALTICGQVASALACAHEQGIIHRDIKPGNILLDANGRARVTDFGIAKVLGANTALTGEQVSVGSPSYMSPEQCGAGQVVPASDLFSLGITLFEALTGKLPYEAETYLGLIKQITQDPLPRMDSLKPDLPPLMQDFVEVLTAKRTTERYNRAGQILEDLNALREGKPAPHLSALRKLSNPGLPAVASAAPPAPVPAANRSLVDDLLDDTVTASYRRIERAPASNSTPWLIAAVAVGACLVGAIVAAIVFRPAAPPAPEPLAPPAHPAGLLPGQPGFGPPPQQPAGQPLQPGMPGYGPPPGAQGQPGQFPPGPPPAAPAGQPQPGEPGYVPPPGYPKPPPHPKGMGGFPPPHPQGRGGFPPPQGAGQPPPPPPNYETFEGQG